MHSDAYIGSDRWWRLRVSRGFYRFFFQWFLSGTQLSPRVGQALFFFKFPGGFRLAKKNAEILPKMDLTKEDFKYWWKCCQYPGSRKKQLNMTYTNHSLSRTPPNKTNDGKHLPIDYNCVKRSFDTLTTIF